MYSFQSSSRHHMGPPDTEAGGAGFGSPLRLLRAHSATEAYGLSPGPGGPRPVAPGRYARWPAWIIRYLLLQAPQPPSFP